MHSTASFALKALVCFPISSCHALSLGQCSDTLGPVQFLGSTSFYTGRDKSARVLPISSCHALSLGQCSDTLGPVQFLGSTSVWRDKFSLSKSSFRCHACRF